MSFVNTPLFSRLIEQSPFSYSELAILILTAPNRYKEHHIEKRSGGLRLIAQPTKELKFMQRLLVNQELSRLPVSEAATAYVANSSIRNHAQKHAGNRYLLKLDFKDFFPSITTEAIDELLIRETQFSADERFIVNHLLLRLPKKEKVLRLSIGAPSSPSVCNWIMYSFDETVLQYCIPRQIAYSRYADDMAFSTNHPKLLDEAKLYIEQLLRKLSHLGLSLHEGKTVNISTKHNRTLTGLVLSNTGQVSIGREKKRLVRAQVHSMMNNALTLEENTKLKGYLSFVYSIDPTFVADLAKRYGLTVTKLLVFNHSQKSNPV